MIYYERYFTFKGVCPTLVSKLEVATQSQHVVLYEAKCVCAATRTSWRSFGNENAAADTENLLWREVPAADDSPQRSPVSKSALRAITNQQDVCAINLWLQYRTRHSRPCLLSHIVSKHRSGCASSKVVFHPRSSASKQLVQKQSCLLF